MALTQKNSLNDLAVGDYVWCKNNVATSAIVGTLSDLCGTPPTEDPIIDNGGLNYGSSRPANYSSSLMIGTDLYIAWVENNAITSINQIRVKKYDGTTWSWIDGGGNYGINYNIAKTSTRPRLTAIGTDLYVVWQEQNVNGLDNIRVKKWDGSVWSFIDGNTVNGLNYNSEKSALDVNVIALGADIYVTWLEGNSGAINQIRVKKWNGTTWTFLDGGGNVGINMASSKHGYSPCITSMGTNIYVSWVEPNASSVQQVRVKKWDGSTWTWADGGVATTGINKLASSHAYTPSIGSSGGNLYVAWTETGSSLCVRLKKYDGTTWTWADGGGTSGLNYSTSASVTGYTPFIATSSTKLYIIWTEHLSGAIASVAITNVRVKEYTTSANWADGGTQFGINHDIGKNAVDPNIIIGTNDIYAVWTEKKTLQDTNTIRVKKATNGIFKTSTTYVSTQNPVLSDGYFKFICVERKNGKGGLLIADRNIQNYIGWDVLSSAGFIEGRLYRGSLGNTKKNTMSDTPSDVLSGGNYTGTIKISLNNNITISGFRSKSLSTLTSFKPVIYRHSDGVKIAEGPAVSANSVGGYFDFMLSTPVTLVSGVEYRIGFAGTYVPVVNYGSTLTPYTANITGADINVLSFHWSAGDTSIIENSSQIHTLLIELLEDKPILIRSLSGGINYAGYNGTIDASDRYMGGYPLNNEWDTHIQRSSLNGNVTPGLDSTWNFVDTYYSWCRETPSVAYTAATYRVCRGGDNSGYCKYVNTSSVYYIGFRPVLEFSEDSSIFI